MNKSKVDSKMTQADIVVHTLDPISNNSLCTDI